MMLVRFAPYLIAAALAFGSGFSAAWYLQGVRLTSARNDLVEYKVQIADNVRHEQEVAQKQQTETANAWARNLEAIRADNDGLRRCIAAGKCRGLPVVPVCGPALKLPASGRPDETGAYAVSDALIKDCQVTTGMLNALQADIEKYQKRTTQ